MDYQLPRRVKSYLTPAERAFLDMLARTNNQTESARACFKDIKNYDQKASRLLRVPLAMAYLKDKRKEALEQAKEEFQDSLKDHYRRLLAQSQGFETTKEKKKEVITQDGSLVELREKEYDKLLATKTILSALGELKDNDNANSVNFVINTNCPMTDE